MPRTYPIIDGHGHILPSSKQIPQSIKNSGHFNIEGPLEKQLMTQDFINWKRPVSHPSFFIEPRLDWMGEHNIAHTVMLTLSQFYCNGINKDATLDIIKFQNDFHLQLQTDYPKQLSCGFVVQPLFLDEALLEIEKRVKEGLKFLCLPTHYKGADGMYRSSTDENCQEIFKLANEFHLPINFHPYDYEEIIKLKDINEYWSGHKSAMPFLTAQFYDMLVSKGIHEAFPNIRYYLSHGNIVSMATIGRNVQAYNGRKDLFPGVAKSPGYALSAKNIFCDSIVHDWDTIWLLKKKVGSAQILHGIDSPYPLGDGVDYVETTLKMYPGFTLDMAEKEGYINPAEKQDILRVNVVNWLYGQDSQQAQNFTKSIGF